MALNSRVPNVPGPRGLKWRDTAIRGHRDRGTGILNNESYIGRIVFNRRQFRKTPETENREAWMNDKSEWVVGEAPDLRIIDDESWAKVKKRQLEVEANFNQTASNRLNRSHRQQYLLSGRLECAHCGGPYAVMAKNRYGCTNHQKKLPIDHLEGVVCPNHKTINRAELEARVLDPIPLNLLSIENITSVQDSINKKLAATQKTSERSKGQLQANLLDVTRRQEIVANQITERLMAGQMQIEAFNKMLDELQKTRIELEADLDRAALKHSGGTRTFSINPSMYQLAMRALTAFTRTGNTEHDDVQQHFNFLRELIQKVVIAPSADGKSADLTIHGRLALILASMAAFQDYSAGLREQHKNDYARW